MGKFLDDTALEAIGENRWRANLQKGWRIGRVPNGGYVLAIVGRAISQSLSHADPLSINAFYLEPTQLGEAEVEVEILRLGKGTQFASARLYQDGNLKIVANSAYADLDRLKGPTNTIMTPPDVPPFESIDVPKHNVLEIHNTIDTRIVTGAEFFTDAFELSSRTIREFKIYAFNSKKVAFGNDFSIVNNGQWFVWIYFTH